MAINPLRAEVKIKVTLRLAVYLTGNTLSLRYKHQPVILFRETVAVYCNEHTKQIKSVGKTQSSSTSMQVVHIVTTGL
jgi:hypothetical protein